MQRALERVSTLYCYIVKACPWITWLSCVPCQHTSQIYSYLCPLTFIYQRHRNTTWHTDTLTLQFNPRRFMSMVLKLFSRGPTKYYIDLKSYRHSKERASIIYFLNLLWFRLPRTLLTSLKSNQLGALYNEQSRAHIFVFEPKSDYVAFRVQHWFNDGKILRAHLTQNMLNGELWRNIIHHI